MKVHGAQSQWKASPPDPTELTKSREIEEKFAGEIGALKPDDGRCAGHAAKREREKLEESPDEKSPSSEAQCRQVKRSLPRCGKDRITDKMRIESRRNLHGSDVANRQVGTS